MKLTPVMEKYVLHWGEMGTRWGVSRSVAQIHALLYLAPRPLTAEEIAETLSIARSNVSTSLKELQSWGRAASAEVHVMSSPFAMVRWTQGALWVALRARLARLFVRPSDLFLGTDSLLRHSWRSVSPLPPSPRPHPPASSSSP